MPVTLNILCYVFIEQTNDDDDDGDDGNDEMTAL